MTSDLRRALLFTASFCVSLIAVSGTAVAVRRPAAQPNAATTKPHKDHNKRECPFAKAEAAAKAKDAAKEPIASSGPIGWRARGTWVA